MTHVAVVGSLNLDVVVSTTQRPRPGETVMGQAYGEHSGGKGANQSVASAQIAPTAMVGAVGDDDAGGRMTAALDSAGVDTRFVARHPGPSGRAVITVTPDGENSIVVLSLANATVAADDVVAALDELDPQAVLTQLETPILVALACARWAGSRGRRFVLNPSPIAPVPADLVAAANPLIVNELEADEIAAGLGLATGGSPQEAVVRLARYCRSVVVTAGADGAWACDGSTPVHVGAPRVIAVDTTGAGDAFAGTLTARLALGSTLTAAVEAAVAVSAALVAVPRGHR